MRSFSVARVDAVFQRFRCDRFDFDVRRREIFSVHVVHSIVPVGHTKEFA